MHDIPRVEPPVVYRPETLEQLARIGIIPRSTTQPRVVYRHLRALMTFEIRERKARRRELERVLGPQPLEDYARQIEELRERYALLRRPIREWLQRVEARD